MSLGLSIRYAEISKYMYEWPSIHLDYHVDHVHDLLGVSSWLVILVLRLHLLAAKLLSLPRSLSKLTILPRLSEENLHI